MMFEHVGNNNSLQLAKVGKTQGPFAHFSMLQRSALLLPPSLIVPCVFLALPLASLSFQECRKRPDHSTILFSLPPRGLQDTQHNKNTVFYHSNWPSGSQNPSEIATFNPPFPRGPLGLCCVAAWLLRCFWQVGSGGHPRGPQVAAKRPPSGPQEPEFANGPGVFITFPAARFNCVLQ